MLTNGVNSRKSSEVQSRASLRGMIFHLRDSPRRAVQPLTVEGPLAVTLIKKTISVEAHFEDAGTVNIYFSSANKASYE